MSDRIWTANSAAGWVQRRDAARAASGLRAIGDLRGSDLEDALEGERRKMFERLQAYYRATIAWTVSSLSSYNYSKLSA